MKVTVEIPDNKRECGACPFLQEILDSWGYEESHNWCAYLREDLNKEVPFSRRVRKHTKCPTKIKGDKDDKL